MKHDERAASAAGLGLRGGEECVRQPTVAQRFLDPHRLQLAIPAPDDGGDARHDATVVVATEDPELPFVTKSGGGDRGGRHLLLEQRQVGRVGRVLNNEFGQPAGRLGHTRSHCGDRVGQPPRILALAAANSSSVRVPSACSFPSCSSSP